MKKILNIFNTKFKKLYEKILFYKKLEFEILKNLIVLLVFNIISIYCTSNLDYSLIYFILFFNEFIKAIFMVRRDFGFYSAIPFLNGFIGIVVLFIKYSNLRKLRLTLTKRGLEILENVNEAYFMTNKFLDKELIYIIKFQYNYVVNNYNEKLLIDVANYLLNLNNILIKLNYNEYVIGFFPSGTATHDEVFEKIIADAGNVDKNIEEYIINIIKKNDDLGKYEAIT